MGPHPPHILLINPWIHDFAAYDFWAKPMGLLILAAILRIHGYRVSYIDCLERFHPRAPSTDPRLGWGRGPYLKTPIPKPRGLKDVPRNFSRYGIPDSWFRDDLMSLPSPDLVLLTSIMTYWWGGVKETIARVKAVFPQTPVVLGGIYATLCHDHAKAFSGADQVLPGPGEGRILEVAATYTGYAPGAKYVPGDMDTHPYPAFDLQPGFGWVPLLTSRGCPFSCAYCASRFLNPEVKFRRPSLVLEEIKHWHDAHGVIDFAFYDDALLMDPEKHAIPLLEKIIDWKLGSKAGVRFHTPNALHIRQITKQTAGLMKRAGFKTIRLGLETASFESRRQMDEKVTRGEFGRAVSCLKQAGFAGQEIGAYLLVGLPGQPVASVARSIELVRQHGAVPVLAYYSPIPHTPLWKKAVDSSRYDLEADPVYSNNAIFPCKKEPFSWDEITCLKNLARKPEHC